MTETLWRAIGIYVAYTRHKKYQYYFTLQDMFTLEGPTLYAGSMLPLQTSVIGFMMVAVNGLRNCRWCVSVLK